MKRRKLALPLESSNWVLIVKAGELHTQYTGADDELVCSEFTQALKAGRLRSRVRRADGQLELLAASAWEDLYVKTRVPFSGLRFKSSPQDFKLSPQDLPRVEMAVFSHKLRGRPPECWFYVWWPDYKNIFHPVTASAEPRTPTPEVPENRGRKPVHDHAELGAVALGLALQRKQGAPPKTQANVVDELRGWCTRNKRKVPADSTLYEIVAAAFRIKPTLKN